VQEIAQENWVVCGRVSKKDYAVGHRLDGEDRHAGEGDGCHGGGAAQVGEKVFQGQSHDANYYPTIPAKRPAFSFGFSFLAWRHRAAIRFFWTIRLERRTL
jgi:hypothetical protein